MTDDTTTQYGMDDSADKLMSDVLTKEMTDAELVAAERKLDLFIRFRRR